MAQAFRKFRWLGGYAVIARRQTFMLSFVSRALDAASDAEPAEKRLSRCGDKSVVAQFAKFWATADDV